MAELLLETETGRELGTRPARRLRREGRVPAVVYGLGQESVSITVDYRELRAVLTTEAGLNALLTLEVEGDRQLSLIKELQRHPVRHDVIHVDFIRVDPDQEVEVEVPLSLVGEAKLVLNEGGIIDQYMFRVSVLAKPQSIPNELEADITELTIGDSIRAADIVLPAGVRLAGDPEEAVAVGSVPAAEEIVEPELDELAEGEELEGEELEGEAAEEAEDESDD